MDELNRPMLRCRNCVRLADPDVRDPSHSKAWAKSEDHYNNDISMKKIISGAIEDDDKLCPDCEETFQSDLELDVVPYKDEA